MDRLIRASAPADRHGRARARDSDPRLRRAGSQAHGRSARRARPALYCRPTLAKPRFGLAGRKVLLTFGLLSPNKGLETMIEALPGDPARSPRHGLCHRRRDPSRISSPAKASATGSSCRRSPRGSASPMHVRWIDSFLDQEQLLDLIEAADLYVTPYLQPRPDHLGHALLRGGARQAGRLHPLSARRRD